MTYKIEDITFDIALFLGNPGASTGQMQDDFSCIANRVKDLKGAQYQPCKNYFEKIIQSFGNRPPRGVCIASHIDLMQKMYKLAPKKVAKKLPRVLFEQYLQSDVEAGQLPPLP